MKERNKIKARDSVSGHARVSLKSIRLGLPVQLSGIDVSLVIEDGNEENGEEEIEKKGQNSLVEKRSKSSAHSERKIGPLLPSQGERERGGRTCYNSQCERLGRL